jgi:hypothetical protein
MKYNLRFWFLFFKGMVVISLGLGSLIGAAYLVLLFPWMAAVFLLGLSSFVYAEHQIAKGQTNLDWKILKFLHRD